MGRNLIPKLGEWRDGELYNFKYIDGSYVDDSSNGKMVVFTCQKGRDAEEQTLATAWADGLQELMAAMYESGFQKGKLAGASEARQEILKALRIDAALGKLIADMRRSAENISPSGTHHQAQEINGWVKKIENVLPKAGK